MGSYVQFPCDPRHSIFWVPGFIGGRDYVESGLLASFPDGKVCAVLRQSPGSGSAGLLVSLVEEKNWNLGGLAPSWMGSSVQDPGEPQVLECRTRCRACFSRFHGPDDTLVPWICWFPSLDGGREYLESGLF